MARNEYHENIQPSSMNWNGVGEYKLIQGMWWYARSVKGLKFSVHTVSVQICTQELAALWIGQNVLGKCSDPTVVCSPGVTLVKY